jgi:hypothetical protein
MSGVACSVFGLGPGTQAATSSVKRLSEPPEAYIMKTRNLFAGALALASLFLVGIASRPASAITLNNGDAAIYNFDFTGQATPPPYFTMILEVFHSVAPGSTAIGEFFPESNGNGASAGSSGSISLNNASFFSPFNSTPGVVDGVFSFVLTVTGGPVEIIGETAFGENAFDHGGIITTFVVASTEGSLASTPLPGALPLFASGLSALGLLGWRRKRKQTAYSTADRVIG